MIDLIQAQYQFYYHFWLILFIYINFPIYFNLIINLLSFIFKYKNIHYRKSLLNNLLI